MTFLNKIIKIIFLLLICKPVFSQEMNVKIRNLYIEVEKHNFANRSYFIPENEDLTNSLNLVLNMDINKYLYLNQRITSQVGTRQFRHIGYQPELGFRSKWGVDLYFRHFSGHALDFVYDRRFPQENAVGVRFNLIRN